MLTPEVWLALPSANPQKARACNRAWQEQGYRTAFRRAAAGFPGHEPVIARKGDRYGDVAKASETQSVGSPDEGSAV